MTPVVRHRKRVMALDFPAPDAALVQPSDWNDDHEVVCAAGRVELWVLPGELPAGWLQCLGQVVRKADFPELYGAIGGAFGESGAYFALPNIKLMVGTGVVKTKMTRAVLEEDESGARVVGVDAAAGSWLARYVISTGR